MTDSTCAALADSARGRLKGLETKIAAKTGSLSGGRPVNDKTLIETP